MKCPIGCQHVVTLSLREGTQLTSGDVDIARPSLTPGCSYHGYNFISCAAHFVVLHNRLPQASYTSVYCKDHGLPNLSGRMLGLGHEVCGGFDETCFLVAC